QGQEFLLGIRSQSARLDAQRDELSPQPVFGIAHVGDTTHGCTSLNSVQLEPTRPRTRQSIDRLKAVSAIAPEQGVLDHAAHGSLRSSQGGLERALSEARDRDVNRADDAKPIRQCEGPESNA